MSDMEQAIAGMTELNERILAAEARAAEAANSGDTAGNDEIACRSERKGETCNSIIATGARDRPVCVEIPAFAV